MQSSQFNVILKLCSHYGHLKASLQNEVATLVSIELDLTNRCNYTCPNCTWGEHNKGRTHVPYEEVMQRVRACADAGIKGVVFSGGGEPLLNSAVSDAIKLAKEIGLNVGIFTNGLLLTSDIAEIVAECCDWVRITLSGVTPEIYTRCHGVDPGNFERLKRNITELNSLIKTRNSGTIVGIGSIINPDNVNDSGKLAELAFQTGCRYFQAKHDFELLSGKDYTAWWESTLVPLLRELKAKYTSEPFEINYTAADYTRKPIASYCYIHHLASAINADGQVVYCKRLRDKPDWSPGNVREQSLKAILASERNKELSRKITPHNCGIICPYLELNDFIGHAVNVKHPNFF